MKKNIKKIVVVAVIAATTGFGVYTTQKSETTLSDISLANVEALADNETEVRDDCKVGDDICSQVVIYPDGDYGEDILLGHTKKQGWL